MQFPDMKLDSYEILPGGAIKKNGETMVPMQIMVPEELKIKFDRANSNWICHNCIGISYDVIGYEEKTPGYLGAACWVCGIKAERSEKPRRIYCNENFYCEQGYVDIYDLIPDMHYITPNMLMNRINDMCKRYEGKIKTMIGRK